MTCTVDIEMKGIRYYIGQYFLHLEDKRVEKALSMPSETEEQRNEAYSYSFFGLEEEEYHQVNKLSHAYAKEKSAGDMSLYAWHYGLKFRYELLQSWVSDFISWINNPFFGDF